MTCYLLIKHECCAADAAASFDPELLLAACAAAVLTVRGGTRGRTAVLDFFSKQLVPHLVQQGSGDGAAAAAVQCGGGMPDSRAMRAWLRRVAPLAGEAETSPLSVPLKIAVAGTDKRTASADSNPYLLVPAVEGNPSKLRTGRQGVCP